MIITEFNDTGSLLRWRSVPMRSWMPIPATGGMPFFVETEDDFWVHWREPKQGVVTVLQNEV